MPNPMKAVARACFWPSRELTTQEIPPLDFHLHTCWTDGKDTAQKMWEAAVANGLRCILFSEHARKTSEDWFFHFAQEVRSLPKSPCRAFVGVETKVSDFDGNLDVTQAIMDESDLVMASVHRFPGEVGELKGLSRTDLTDPSEIEFRLAWAVLDNPAVDILGHPFGMTFNRFGLAPMEKNVKALIAKAAEKDVAFEVNSQYHPDPWLYIRWCKEAGAKVSLGSNAHSVDRVGTILKVLRGDKA